MRRLYHQFYLAIIASLVLAVVTAGALWRFAPYETAADQALEMAGSLVAAQLAVESEDRTAQQRAVERLHERLQIDLGLFDSERQPLAAAGEPVPPPPKRRESGGWIASRGGAAWAIRLPDGRWVVARPPPRKHRPLLGLIGFLGSIAVLVAICAYPLARRLTRRLERLQAGVESLGAGDLSARVKVEGRDEVARLAECFNRSAARIEELVAAHKMLLASTSHELRTPLSRIRLGIEMLMDAPDPKRRASLERDIMELDGLIEQILLSSRLDALKRIDVKERIDLLALAAEEGAHHEHCTTAGEPVFVSGDRMLLRQLVRNLIDNAEKYGTPPIEIEVDREQGLAVMTIADSGAGISAGDAERNFLPFYRGAKSAGKSGAGLGLSLVRQIARRHGGDAVWVGDQRRPSTIRVSIPVAV
jgi:signal transduction histidine kinase